MAETKQFILPKGKKTLERSARGERSDGLQKRLSALSADGDGAPPPLPNSPPKLPDGKTSEKKSSFVDLLKAEAKPDADSRRELERPSKSEKSEPEPDYLKKLATAASEDESDEHDDDDDAVAARRAAKRRPAGPVRERVAANDDAPSIGGLIYALQEKPSQLPFRYAAIASVVWTVVGLSFGGLNLWSNLSESDGLSAVMTRPEFFLTLAATIVPIAVMWFLALLAWRAEELRLRSSTMTEVAVRLAEPDRLAEQSVASLGQAVRRQVSFMNDAVSRALGRAGELEALVHNEVAALERSYEENERKIRELIGELCGEREALASTGTQVTETLRTLGTEVPALIGKLSNQQAKLAHIIQGAGDNLTALETSLSDSVGQLEGSLGSRTDQLQAVLSQYTGALDTALGDRTDQMRGLLDNYTTALADALGTRSDKLSKAFDEHMRTLDASIGDRTDTLQAVFEEYARALDATLANRAEALDAKLVERTRALDQAFNQRLQLFDDSVMRSTKAIDHAVGERAAALTNALDTHAKTFKETVTHQANELDESLVHGINSVRRSSENITRQSLKAIEGLAGQSELLKNVSENLLSQIHSVTNRFDSQSQSIMKSANALETANYKIDATLQHRHAQLSQTLDRMSGKADEFGRFIEGYSSTIEGSISEAEHKARVAAEQLRAGAETQKKQTLAEIERIRAEADVQSTRALEDLRHRFSSVSDEVATQLGSLSGRVEESTEEMRRRTETAAVSIAEEHQRLKEQFDSLPVATQESTEAMRRALQDQLRALGQLSAMTTRTAHSRDVKPPDGSSKTLTQSYTDNQAHGPPAGHVDERALSSLSTSLAQELGTRRANASPTPNGARHGRANGPSGPVQQPRAATPPSHDGKPPVQQPQSGQRPQQQMAPATQASKRRTSLRAQQANADEWSLGDLLKRASVQDDHAPASGPAQQSAGRHAAAAHPSQTLLDVQAIARALDQQTAAVLWSRLRAGHRGILVRSMYAPEGRTVFDEFSRRYAGDAALQQTVGRYMVDYEQTLRELEQKDPTGRMVQDRLISEMGRVYLFLAHVSGRLK